MCSWLRITKLERDIQWKFSVLLTSDPVLFSRHKSWYQCPMYLSGSLSALPNTCSAFSFLAPKDHPLPTSQHCAFSHNSRDCFTSALEGRRTSYWCIAFIAITLLDGWSLISLTCFPPMVSGLFLVFSVMHSASNLLSFSFVCICEHNCRLPSDGKKYCQMVHSPLHCWCERWSAMPLPLQCGHCRMDTLLT